MPSIAARLREMRDSHRDSSLKPSPLQINVHLGDILPGDAWDGLKPSQASLKHSVARRLLRRRGRDVIGLDQGYTSGVTYTANNSRITTRRDCGLNNR